LKAVVLAAGQGVRLWPLTENRPKHMIPIGGRPILSYIMESLRKNGVTDVLVMVGYKKEAIQNYLGDGSRFDVHVRYMIQPQIAGTADAVRLAEDYVADEPFLVVYGDQLIAARSVEKVLTVHETYRRDNVMALVPVDRPEYYGLVSVEGSNVKGIMEKPSARHVVGNLVNAGLYVLKPEVFSMIRETKKSKRGELEVTDSIQFLIRHGSEVKAALIDGDSWIDIGRPWDLLEANERILKLCEHRIDGVIEEGAKVTPPIVLSKNVRVRTGSVVMGPVFVGEGSELGPNCRIRPFTSIGKDVRVGPSCDIKNSIIMDGTKVPHLTYIGDSVIGERCNFGAGTNVANLRLDDATVKTPIRGKIIDSGRRKLGVILGDDVRTGINASLMPGVKVGSGSWIGPSVVIGKDVPSGTTILLKQQLIESIRHKKKGSV
jgi:UDP-N-acetylglucosamine diphosphorylase/glucosamine-1-phosphate N-acetyltransferase